MSELKFDKNDLEIMEYCDKGFVEHKKNFPASCFKIARSKNKNMVVYGAILKDGKIDSSNPVEVYWMDIDPPAQAARIKAGGKSDRTELGAIEWKMAYGLKWEAAGGDEYKITLTALPSRPLRLKLDKDGHPIMIININGKACVLEKIFAKSVEGFVMSTCVFVEIRGTNLDTGKEEIEKIDASKV
jgi:hypothetical protein